MTDDVSTWLHALRPDALKHLCPYPRHLNGIADVFRIGFRLICILGGLILVHTVHSTLLPFCSVLESPFSVLGRFIPPLRLNLTLVRALNAILHASVTAVLREVFGEACIWYREGICSGISCSAFGSRPNQERHTRRCF